MTRLFTNRDADVRQAGRPRAGKPAPQANFKHSLAALAQNLEGLLLRHTAFVSETLERICMGRDRSAQATLQLVPVALAAASPEMVAAQSRYRLAKSTPAPMNMP